MAKQLIFTVPNDCDNILAQRFLRDKCGLSARIITRLKREKNGILMDGKILRTIDFVQKGKDIIINLPNETSGIEPIKGALNIAYEDDYFLIIDKPPMMPVHPVKQHQTDTLANIVAYYCRQKGEDYIFRAVNRLDRDTSGLVIIAKNRFCANALKNITHKKYYALCEGKIESAGTIDKPIDLKENSKMVRVVRSDGMPSVTHYKPIFCCDDYSLLELWLETGRTHQIRCHMAYLGHPLVGDDLYGGSLEFLTRQALHCREISFVHPITNQQLVVRCKIPDDINNIIKIKQDTAHNLST